MSITTAPSSIFAVQRAGDRFHAEHGWLQARHSFSFADYHDPNNMGWGALRVFNDDTIAAAQGFPPHPHRDMEIVTYVLSGSLEHKDSLGNHGVVHAGGVQFMSAGTGVLHSEFNGSQSEPLHLVQMWVIPGKAGVAPLYGQADFTTGDRLDQWLTVASGETGVEAPITLTQSATLRVSRLENAELRHPFNAGRYGFLFVADGSVAVHGGSQQEQTLRAGDALRTYDIAAIELQGTGEIVFWDVARLDAR